MKGNIGGWGCDVVTHKTATLGDLNCIEEVADNLKRPATGSLYTEKNHGELEETAQSSVCELRAKSASTFSER